MIHHGDLFDVLPTFEANSIDAAVTDPPYGIGFMGREWDTFKPGTGKNRKLMHPRERIASKNPNIDGRHRSPALSPSQIDYDYSTAGLRGFQQWTERWAVEVFRVLKPGAYIVVCGAPRSHHRMMCGLEDAGFVVRDCFAWLFLSGFPKSHNFGCKCGENALPYNHDGEPETERDLRRVPRTDVSAAVNAGGERGQVLLDGLSEHGAFEQGTARTESETAGREQPGLERRQLHRAGEGLSDGQDAGASPRAAERLRARAHRGSGEDARPSAEGRRGSASRGPRSSEQRSGEPEDLRFPPGALADGAYDRGSLCTRCGGLTAARGLGTALKPSNEPICIAWKPFKGTIANNFIKHGTGGLNIDACRLSADGNKTFDREAGDRRRDEYRMGTTVGASVPLDIGRWPANTLIGEGVALDFAPYFYVPKPSREERDYGTHGLTERQRDDSRKAGNPGGDNPRNRGLQPRGNFHPTVKPVELMRWLVKLVTPIGGTVIDPFTGSGTTGMACRYEQREFIGIEREAEYLAIAERRIAAVAPLFNQVSAECLSPSVKKEDEADKKNTKTRRTTKG